MMNLNGFFDGLNKNQIEAVKATEKYVKIIAGAGSGKTRVIANRYAYIVESLGISPSNILCVTFTNRAAREMKTRIHKLLSNKPANDFICTYHAFCLKILKEEIFRINYPKTFSIIDSEDQKDILKDVYEKLEIKSTEITYKEALKLIREFKALQSDYMSRYVLSSLNVENNNNNSLKNNIIIEYIKNQKKYFALDFDDLMIFALYILNHFDDALIKWSGKLHYIMVDEVQDNSLRQWSLLKLLSNGHENVMLVGDPDQSIYEWRGANPAILVKFGVGHPDVKHIILDQNYRSTSQILNIANSLIAKNKVRISKNMFTINPKVAKVIHYHAKTVEEESKWVVKIIKEKLDDGLSIERCAILYRASFITRPFEQALIDEKIPYIIYGGIRFFERKEIKDSIAYLRLIAYNDDLSFKRIINNPKRKLGKVFINKVKEFSEINNCSLLEALQRNINDEKLDRKNAREFLKMIKKFRGEAEKMKISDLLHFVLTESGLMQSIRLDGDEERIENIEELQQSVRFFEESNTNEEHILLSDYLQEIALYTNIDYKNDKNYLKLMTIHQSKGMEFNTVFVVGMSEGIFPSHRSIRERKMKALEEERRLAYVAITRAEDELYLTESEGLNYNTGYKYPSRFIFEIKEDLFISEGNISQELIKNSKELIRRVDEQHFGLNNSPQPKRNDFVQHPIFGKGIVKVVNTENYQYDVFFPDIGKNKPINFDYEDLHLVEKNINHKLDQNDRNDKSIGKIQEIITLENDVIKQSDLDSVICQNVEKQDNFYPFACPECSFATKFAINDLPERNKKKTYTCQHCGTKFEIRIPDTLCLCEKCNIQFSNIQERDAHMVKNHETIQELDTIKSKVPSLEKSENKLPTDEEIMEIFDLTDHQFDAELTELFHAGVPKPKLYYELSGKRGECIAQAILAWTEYKIAIVIEAEEKIWQYYRWLTVINSSFCEKLPLIRKRITNFSTSLIDWNDSI